MKILVIGLLCACSHCAEANLFDALNGLRAKILALLGRAPPQYPQQGGWQPGLQQHEGGGWGFAGVGGAEYTTLYPPPPPTTTHQLTPEEWWATTTTLPPPTTAVIEGTPDVNARPAEEEMLKTYLWQGGGNGQCTERFQAPWPAPNHATDLNGVQLQDTCFNKYGPTHVFAIGDWGGVLYSSGWIMPADHRSKMFGPHHRNFILGADDMAQKNVAAAIAERAQYSNPDYFLNVGDNFYWGGLNVKCGAPPARGNDVTGQWARVFEDMYKGPGVDGKQWLGVLGNHDYGGYMFTQGWDQAISYTWADNVATSGHRWMTPAQYWQAKVNYADFSVDYYFIDNNNFDSFVPDDQPGHNMCSRVHNLEEGATCGQQGPVSLDDCPGWFKRLWEAEVQWMNEAMSRSQAQWQIIVIHFPPEGAWGEDHWRNLGYTHGIDMIIAGHRHKQSFSYMYGNALAPTAVMVTGGGGGITSEYVPSADGIDDQYGFADMTMTANEIMVEMISHKSQIRSTTCITHRERLGQGPVQLAGQSLCEGRPPKGPHYHTPAEGDPSIAHEKDDDPPPVALGRRLHDIPMVPLHV